MLPARPHALLQEVVPLAEGGMRATGLPAHLKTIEVVNFMCHENFKMDFGPVGARTGFTAGCALWQALLHCWPGAGCSAW